MNKFKRMTDADVKDISKRPIVQNYYETNPEEEVWMNDEYRVNVRRGQECFFKNKDGSPVLVTHLSICRLDRKATPLDWRHFQYIKNELVGEENEGCELYPAESRLIDGSNQFHIWVFEDTDARFPFGFTGGRAVTQSSFIGEVQRPFAPDRVPKDLGECEARVKKALNEFNDK